MTTRGWIALAVGAALLGGTLLPPTRAMALTNAGNVAMLHGRAGTAAALLEVAAQTAPSSAAERSLARARLAEGRIDAAAEAARRAVAIDPNDRLGWWLLGQALWEGGDRDGARRVWRESGVLRRDLDGLLFSAWGSTDPANAESLLRQALDRDPEYGPAYDALATVLWPQQAARGPEVIAAVEGAIRTLPPESAGWYWNQGRLALLRGQPARAVEPLRLAIQLGTGEWADRFLIDALEASGDAAGAAAARAALAAKVG